MEASEAGDISLMKAMKEINGKKSTGQSMPDNIEGKTDIMKYVTNLGKCMKHCTTQQSPRRS